MLRHLRFRYAESISDVEEMVTGGCVSFFLPGFCCAIRSVVKIKLTGKRNIFFIDGV
jgi:hypothetical protein